MGFAPGDRVDRYEILELLGSGGMGEVYRARDRKLERLVALKVVRVDKALGTDGAARLLREARAAAALSHPNVLAIYDVGEVQEPEALRGLAYIAMELVVGKSLRAYIGDPSVSMEQRISWMKDVARALGAAHEAGIVHRDVKPENVMVGFDGVVKVLDFGIARRAAGIDAWSSTEGHSLPTHKGWMNAAGLVTVTQDGAIVGTPFYMAPEQLKGDPLDGRADQFAWGVMAYELLTGQPPWKKGRDALAVAAEILTVEPQPLRALSPSTPQHVESVVLRALSKAGAFRFSSMDLLVAALDGLPERGDARDESVSVARSKKGSRSRRLRWGLLGLAVFLMPSVTAVYQSQRAGSSSAVLSATVSSAGITHCSSNRECSMLQGGMWRCQTDRHECVSLESEDCEVHASSGAFSDEGTVWIGGLYPKGFGGEDDAVELARREFSDALGTSSAGVGTERARPIGVVMCDERKNSVRAAHHLVDDVQVPAVLGFRSRTTVLSTVPNIFLPHHVLSVIALAQDTNLTQLPEPVGDPRLIWRTTLRVADQRAPTAALISDVLVPMVRKRAGNVRPVKLAVLTREGLDADIGEWIEMLEGTHGIYRTTDKNLKVFSMKANAGESDHFVIKELLDFAPDIILDWLPASAERVVLPLELGWRGDRRPYYIEGSTYAPTILRFIGRDGERRRRFWAVTNVSSRRQNAELVAHHNLMFPNDRVTLTTAPQPSYDGFYMLAYAVYAAGDGDLDGWDLSKAFEKLLPPGVAIDVGPRGIFDAFRILRSGGGIDLDGSLGALDFDPRTGEAPVDYSILCCGVDRSGAASGSVESGLVYKSLEGRLVGAASCP